VERARYVIQGTVQGVGFRWFVARQAERLDVTGWTRNMADGSVEVVAEGENLGRLEELLARGPSSARVTNVDKHELSHQIDIPKTFSIK
jgi:acylphosphatase